jgi:GTPase SAR1 family protein
MVLYKDGKVYLKIVYWGMGGSGKTTILKTLYRITKESKKDIIPIGDLQIIDKASGATLYFDRGLFQSTKQKKVYYRVYTVAGQKGFSPLRKKIFDKTEDQTDAVILVVDSQTKFLEDNVESLLELKNMARNRLINEIPMIVMLNKQDLDNIIDEEDFKLVLKDEKLWNEPDSKLYNWNPLIYSSCAIFEQQKDIYRSFHECARRTVLYHIYGDGKAPSDQEILDNSIVNI